MSTVSPAGERVILDGSRLITESLVRAGARAFVGYPITPANLIYAYAANRFPVALAAPDEITALQWVSGFSASGVMPVTATSFPGFALMVETLNMAYMMELPLVIVLAQRLGPSTGTATAGAQGDLMLLNGVISGGYPLPTICVSNLDDCWTLAAESVRMALALRTPVVLLTSAETVMTTRSFDVSALPAIEPASWPFFEGEGKYQPYAPGDDLVPPFVPVGNDTHQVRLNASTHDVNGILQNDAPDALANTMRLQKKLEKNLSDHTFFELEEDAGAEVLVVSYDVTASAAREAVGTLRREGVAVSLLVAKTLLPVPPEYLEIAERYKRIVFAEENYDGQLRRIWFGARSRGGVSGVNAIGRMVAPEEICEEVKVHV
ncbi:MAG: hypothetical protein P8181_10165 [bacterium]